MNSPTPAPTRGTKRSMESLSDDEDGKYPPEDEAYTSASEDSDTPRILHRHRHRLYTAGRAIAAATPAAQKPAFNIFKAIVRHPNLFFDFTRRLPPQTLLDLYAIDKEFHYRFNQYSHSLTHDYIKHHAPDAADVFVYSLYSKLCISDPGLKPMDGRNHLARDVPSLRWTKLVIFRDKVVKQILTELALEGHRVPRATAKVVMKYWMLMEMSKQRVRDTLVRSPSIWTDADLLLFQLFLVKLDMRFSHPVQGQGICMLSHLLLTQKSLVPLRDVLSGRRTMDYDDLSDMVLRTYPQSALDLDAHPWMDDWIDSGVEEWEWGVLMKEGWDNEGTALTPAVDMLVTEGVRRGLHVQRFYLDFVMYGYVDGGTGENVAVPRKWRGDAEVVVPTKGWPEMEEMKALEGKWKERFGKEPERKGSS